MEYIGQQYETLELVFQGPEPCGSQVEIDLRADVAPAGQEPVRVKGFYAGGRHL